MVVKRQHKQQLPPFGLKLSWCTFFSLSCVLSFLAFFLRTKLLYRLFHPHDSYIQLFTRELRERERKSALQSQTALVKLCNLINIDTCQFLSNEIFFFVLVVLFRGILGVCVASCGALVIVFMDFSPTNKRQKVFETHNATLLASALTKLFELSCCSMDSMDGKKRTTSKIIFNII